MESLRINDPSMYNLTEQHTGNFMKDNQRQALLDAYYAGIIDGEGSICITKDAYESVMLNSRLKNPRYLPLIRVGMINKDLIESLKNHFKSGNVYYEGVRKSRPTCRPMSRWVVVNRFQCMEILKRIQPYLIVKKQQSQLLMDFCINFKTPFNRQHGVDEIELQRREDLYQKVRKLNAVGAAAETNPLSTGDGEVIVRT